MAETYLITAKTVEEAVSVAKREYEDARHEVSYEIVEMPKKGFLGLGAKPAKIKVTVSKVMTVQSELGSLVADIKNLKNLTDRDGRDTRKENEAKKPQAPQTEGNGQQKKAQSGQNNQKQQNQNQKQNQKAQNQAQNGGQAKKQNGQNQPAAQNQNGQAQKQKDQTPKDQAQQKQQSGQPQKQGRQNQNRQNQNQNQNAQPQQKQPAKEQRKPEAAEPVTETRAPAQEKTPVRTEAKPAPVQEKVPAEVPVTEEPTPAFGESTGYRSALGNQAKPQRRNRQRRSAKSAEEASVEATGVTVSAPVGLTDFVSEPAAEGAFGQDDGRSSGSRMNNDVRRKNRQQKEAAKPAAPAAPAVPAPVTESAPSESAPSRRQRGRRPANIQKAVNEDLASRYDIAETDEDYEKLDRLTAEAEPAPVENPAKEAPAPAEDRRREAITREEMDYALEFANTLLRNMQLDARAVPAECPEGEEFVVTETADVYPKIDIIGSETGILIGHHGETLDSIQYLVNLSALRKTRSRDGDYVKIVVDIENYREKREETLRTLARRMAARAVRYKRNVFLEPMNAYERRIIHSELQSFENVSTHSVGADRDRKIIITYEGPDRVPEKTPAPEGRRRRRGEDGEGVSETPSEKTQERSEGRRRRGSSAEAVTAETEEKRERRPRKPSKMPIEQLTDWLPDAGAPEEGEASGEEDVLHVMSGLRETFRESVEEIDEVMAEPAEDFEEPEEPEEPAETEEPEEIEAPVEAGEPAEEPVEESAEAPAETEEPEEAEIPGEEPVEEPTEISSVVEEAVEEAAEAVSETVEEAAESFDEKAQALTDIIEAIGEETSGEAITVEEPVEADPEPESGEAE